MLAQRKNTPDPLMQGKDWLQELAKSQIMHRDGKCLTRLRECGPDTFGHSLGRIENNEKAEHYRRGIDGQKQWADEEWPRGHSRNPSLCESSCTRTETVVKSTGSL